MFPANNGPTQDFVLSLYPDTILVGEENNAFLSMSNPRFVTSSGEEIADICGPADYFDCIADGGNLLLEAPQPQADGSVLEPGCYHYDGCASTLPGILGKAQEWSCENMEEVQFYGSIIVVGALIVVLAAPVAPWAAASGLIGLSTSLWSCNENLSLIHI